MAGAAATSGRCHKNGKRQNGFSCTFVFFVAMAFILSPRISAKGRLFRKRIPARIAESDTGYSKGPRRLNRPRIPIPFSPPPGNSSENANNEIRNN